MFGIHIAEADADILMNEIVFNEVRLIYFKGETEEHDEFEIDRDDEKTCKDHFLKQGNGFGLCLCTALL